MSAFYFDSPPIPSSPASAFSDSTSWSSSGFGHSAASSSSRTSSVASTTSYRSTKGGSDNGYNSLPRPDYFEPAHANTILAGPSSSSLNSTSAAFYRQSQASSASSPNTFCSITRTTPNASPLPSPSPFAASRGSSQSDSFHNGSGTPPAQLASQSTLIPDLTIPPAILSYQTSPASVFSRAPSTSSVSEYGEDEECPPNFAEVAPHLYRSSFPRAQHFGFLRTLGLKAVLSFTEKEYPEENKEFFAAEGIKFLQIPMPGNKEDSVRVPSQLIRDALAFALDPSNYPLLLHCNKGKHRTGCVVGCLRKLQNWDIADVTEEYRRYSFPKSRAVDEQCITRFDVEPVWTALVETGVKPSWLEAYRPPC